MGFRLWLADGWAEIEDLLVLALAGLALSLWAIGTIPAFAEALSFACASG